MATAKKHKSDEHLARMFGVNDDDESDASADDEEHVTDEEHEGAVKDAGDAMIAAHRSGDGHGVGKAVHMLMDLHREKKRDSKDEPNESDDDGD